MRKRREDEEKRQRIARIYLCRCNSYFVCQILLDAFLLFPRRGIAKRFRNFFLIKMRDRRKCDVRFSRVKFLILSLPRIIKKDYYFSKLYSFQLSGAIMEIDNLSPLRFSIPSSSRLERKEGNGCADLYRSMEKIVVPLPSPGQTNEFQPLINLFHE